MDLLRNVSGKFLIRVACVLVEEGKLLIIDQKIDENRNWYLPGGQVEEKETLEEAISREMKEETGLFVKVEKLLAVGDTRFERPALHLLFQVRRTGGMLMAPGAKFGKNPIENVEFVEIERLGEYGFSEAFIKMLQEGFPLENRYVGRDPFFDFQ